MRPDKKKVRHHDSRKREEKAKAKASSSEPSKAPSKNQSPPPRDGDVDDNSEEVDARYKKRSVSNNWTKYEIPSSSEDDEGPAMTGEDFNVVLQGAGGAASMLRMKGEKEWEEDGGADVYGANSDLFSLDLTSLEKAISTIPLLQQIGLGEEEIDARTVERLNKKAAENLKNFAQAAQNKPNSSTVDDEPNQRLLEALKSATIEDKKVEKKAVTNPTEQDEAVENKVSEIKEEVKDLEEWLDDFLDE